MLLARQLPHIVVEIGCFIVVLEDKKKDGLAAFPYRSEYHRCRRSNQSVEKYCLYRSVGESFLQCLYLSLRGVER